MDVLSVGSDVAVKFTLFGDGSMLFISYIYVEIDFTTVNLFIWYIKWKKTRTIRAVFVLSFIKIDDITRWIKIFVFILLIIQSIWIDIFHFTKLLETNDSWRQNKQYQTDGSTKWSFHGMKELPFFVKYAVVTLEDRKLF